MGIHTGYICSATFMYVVAAAWMARAIPVQIHLSITSRPDETIVFWITEAQPETSTVKYGRHEADLNLTAIGRKLKRYQYRGIGMQQGYRSGFIHEVVISNLQLSDFPVTYFYRCGDEEDGWSEVRSFRTRPWHPDAPVRFAANGDSVSQFREYFSDVCCHAIKNQ